MRIAKDEKNSARRREGSALVALAGNPNVGKSTLFNLLTGMRQHTGNWSGKTVGAACGYCSREGREYTLVDLPGAYSLVAGSAEEELSRDFICFGEYDAIVLVCDATCLRRTIGLALQVMEITKKVAVCVNLTDEAEKKGIHIDLRELGSRLGAPVVGVSASLGEGVDELLGAVRRVLEGGPLKTHEPPDLNEVLTPLSAFFEALDPQLPAGWLAARLAEGDESLAAAVEERIDAGKGAEFCAATEKTRGLMAEKGLSPLMLSDASAMRLAARAEEICDGVVSVKPTRAAARDRKIDRILTHPVLGLPVMLLMLALILWITLVGANVPSALLSQGLFALGDFLNGAALGLPETLRSMLFDGVYRTVAWVVSVMLPPMAIFFPLFTLLEDLGYLPRVAFNLDGAFAKCSACGKQGLTMCMGLGCNAAGVIGCRIIDSPRERLLAMLTNSFIPCNGRFPMLLTLASAFFAAGGASLASALALTGFIVLGVVMTLLATKLLSKTLLRGLPSSFTLELPPYRRPRIGQVITRSLLDRTLFVLGRALKVAAPAGLVIWLMANTQPGGVQLITAAAGFLEPAARAIGLDGVILLAFILALPANEIVLPIIIMCYLSAGTLTEPGSVGELHALLTQNGWTFVTALCTMLFSLMHWPCGTTLLTIKKEAGGLRWAVLAALLPTAFGVLSCFIVSGIAGFF